MEPIQSQAVLEAMMVEKGVDGASITAAAAVDLMLDFYGVRRATGVAGLDEDGDMLLFEWGVFDWGEGPSFEFGLTRQFILDAEVGDEAITQLKVILHFDATRRATGLGRGHRWCHRPDEIGDFRSFVESSSAAAYARDHTPIRTEVTYDQV